MIGYFKYFHSCFNLVVDTQSVANFEVLHSQNKQSKSSIFETLRTNLKQGTLKFEHDSKLSFVNSWKICFLFEINGTTISCLQ